MLNAREIYYEAGAKARLARRQHDEARARNMMDWLRQAIALEKLEDRRVAEEAWKQGYENG